jgi:hypothetical protein
MVVKIMVWGKTGQKELRQRFLNFFQIEVSFKNLLVMGYISDTLPMFIKNSSRVSIHSQTEPLHFIHLLKKVEKVLTTHA